MCKSGMAEGRRLIKALALPPHFSVFPPRKLHLFIKSHFHNRFKEAPQLGDTNIPVTDRLSTTLNHRMLDSNLEIIIVPSFHRWEKQDSRENDLLKVISNKGKSKLESKFLYYCSVLSQILCDPSRQSGKYLLTLKMSFDKWFAPLGNQSWYLEAYRK